MVRPPKKLWLLAAALCEGEYFSYLLGFGGLGYSNPLLNWGWGPVLGWRGLQGLWRVTILRVLGAPGWGFLGRGPSRAGRARYIYIYIYIYYIYRERETKVEQLIAWRISYA